MNGEMSNDGARTRAVNGLLQESTLIAWLIRGMARSPLGFLRNYEHIPQL
jgi:hypothetical protein